MIKLITNSDDFGLTVSVTDAIIDTHLNGIMTSTTMMANMDGFEYAVKKAKELPNLGIGIHFNLTDGKPLSPPSLIPDLVNSNGEFKSNVEQRKNLLAGRNKLKQVKIELQAQIERLLDNGILPTHFDSHHHITGVPLAFEGSVEVSNKFNLRKARITNIDYHFAAGYKGGFAGKIKLRIKTLPKRFIHKRNQEKLNSLGFKTPNIKILPGRVLPAFDDPINQFIQTLSILKNGITEISFHPGYTNSYIKDSEKTAQLRLRDLEVSKSIKVKEFIKEHHIQLINFRDI